MYPTNWHTEYGHRTSQSAHKILSYITKHFSINSAVEIGCGDGHWTIEAQNLGVAETLGVDGPWTDRKTLKLGGEHFLEHDFSEAFNLGRKFDIAICLEVAEHVNIGSSDRLVDSLILASDLQLFGAAIPLQRGAHHINEQWQSWWMHKFAKRGFVPFDFVRPVFWSDQDVHYWYRQNIIVYINSARTDLITVAKQLQADAVNNSPVVDMVHPEKFTATASYESIHFKSLFKKLPRKLLERFMRVGR